MLEKMFLIVGEYAGIEFYGAALLQRMKYSEELCLTDFVYPHGQPEEKPNMKGKERKKFEEEKKASDETRKEILAATLVPVEKVRKVLASKNITLPKDQERAVVALGRMTGLFTGLKGPPGAAKSMIMGSFFACLVDQLKPHQRLLWLTKTRKQRGKSLRDGRILFDDARVALGLGRSDDTAPKDGDYGEWDPLAVEFVESRVGHIVLSLQELQQELKKTPFGVAFDTAVGQT